ncbi:SDR family oxidoreductase [Silicimonas algicola]|uniref:3-oxoacyl-[acyl-carrier protein] reductase n=1 Tax=Silicimonas algicola TaxID=1826607 RepID=A0A316G322_9RHOB|nr:SDR family oxidoreductase [Silicimonas algicola]AZQ67125.1 SDR family oxidoreductase [Silicimonas algicola]PWK55341.1 3-oxoacyl-[acyl-carrier protein] reductase [Silicimonas algicola]
MLNRTDRPLAGKAAVVTGASRRIGRAVALGLAQAGADVLVHARQSREEVEAVAEEVRGLGARAVVALGDVTVEEDVSRIFQAASDAFGGVDILVNNAAIRAQAPFLEMTLADWRGTTAVILDGAFLCSRAALRSMVGRGGGTIVNLGGVSAHVGAKERAHVATAKAGLVGLTKSLALEFADRNITVNCVAPGKIGGKRSATAGKSPEMASRPIVGRDGEIEEAAFVILSLCMPEARFMTGQTVHVSGGMYMP